MFREGISEKSGSRVGLLAILISALFCLTACKKEPVPPKAAIPAVTIAMRYVVTNGCQEPVFRDAWIANGVWHIALTSKKFENEIGSGVIVQVSAEGKVLHFARGR